MEIVGSQEEVRLYKVQRNRQQCESSGSLRLLGLLPHITGDKVQCTSKKQCEFSGQPCQHPLCHRRGKNFTFFWPHWCFLFNPGTSLFLDGDLLSSSGTAKLARPWACSRPGSRQISSSCHLKHHGSRCVWLLHWFGSSFRSRHVGSSLRCHFSSITYVLKI